MSITVNGQSRDVPAGITVADLVAQLGWNAGRVAIERNREILPRSQWSSTAVEPGDTYEIVQFVGGG
ncbi:MAG TPA: sulfur carrier protein ThiS [Candidatus Acidoferrales bacterium]|nr:sulfur carrier protein ThiS [Candidatus Acidoferrales bacterium]